MTNIYLKGALLPKFTIQICIRQLWFGKRKHVRNINARQTCTDGDTMPWSKWRKIIASKVGTLSWRRHVVVKEFSNAYHILCFEISSVRKNIDREEWRTTMKSCRVRHAVFFFKDFTRSVMKFWSEGLLKRQYCLVGKIATPNAMFYANGSRQQARGVAIFCLPVSARHRVFWEKIMNQHFPSTGHRQYQREDQCKNCMLMHVGRFWWCVVIFGLRCFTPGPIARSSPFSIQWFVWGSFVWRIL